MHAVNKEYRSEIDGLRAVAVVSVLLYHAGFVFLGKPWATGGFIGVDIFFTISGYLITRIILKELYEKSSFNFRDFYQRRARRILPMLFVVLLVSFPLAWYFLLPTSFVEYSISALSAIFFASNFFFYFSTTEYGATSSLLIPLLHTWSLGVEEQFYILLPLLCVVVFKTLKNHILLAFALLFGLSLGGAIFLSAWDATMSFYSPFSRFWELLAGSMLAYVEIRHKDYRHKHFNHAMIAHSLPLAGLGLILYAILYFDAQTLHPGFSTLIPILGVCLIIAFASPRDWIGRLLSSKPFVGIGLISYSLYLWHYPIFAFARISNTKLGHGDKLALIALTVGLSILTYFFIEKLFRKTLRWNHAFWALFLTFLMVTFVNITVVALEGYKFRFPAIANYEPDNKLLKKKRGLESMKHFKTLYPNPALDNVLIVGNSHGEQMAMMLQQIPEMKSTFNVYWEKPSNKNYFQLPCFDARVDNKTKTDDIFFQSKAYKNSDIIIIATRYYSTSNPLQICEFERKNLKGDPFSGLRHLVDAALKDGKRVVLISNTLEFAGAFVDAVYKRKYFNGGDFQRKNFNKEDLYRQFFDFPKDSKFKLANQKLKVVAEELQLPLWNLESLGCDVKAKKCFGVDASGHKLYYDYGHYTVEGISFFAQRLASQGFVDWLHKSIK